MKKIELVPGIQSSVLGFGCAPILGSVGSAKADKALHAALESGINHFDIARSYGYGEAEQFVGKVLKPYRSNVIIASKFGIKENFKAKLLKPLKPVIRFAKELKGSPSASGEKPKNITAGVADRFLNRITLNPAEMQKSLEESLRALKTDYLDYFFIHEPPHTIEHIDALCKLADDLKQAGKIRAWGLAYMGSQQHLHQEYLNRFDVLQFNNSPGIEGYDDLKHGRAREPNIFFSPINGGTPSLSPAQKLQTLHNDFPKSVILCSMFNEKHLKSNAQLFM